MSSAAGIQAQFAVVLNLSVDCLDSHSSQLCPASKLQSNPAWHGASPVRLSASDSHPCALTAPDVLR